MEFLNDIGCSPKRYVQVQPKLLDLKEEVVEGIPMTCADEWIKVASFGIKNGSYRQIAMQGFVHLFALLL